MRPKPGSAREQLDELVRMTLISAINDHGTITRENAGSAAKRVTGQLMGSKWEELAVKTATSRLWKRLEMLKHGHDRLVSYSARLRGENEAMRKALTALQQWDMLTLDADGHGVATADAPWARQLISNALGDYVPVDA